MKAIACPQCGALIKKVSERQMMTNCAYCGANVLMPKDRKYFLDVEAAANEDVPNENITESGKNNIWSSPFSDQGAYSETFDKKYNANNSFVAVIAVVCAGFFVLIVIFVGISSREKAAETVKYPTPYKYPTPPMPSYTPFVMPSIPIAEYNAPQFDLSYRVSWNGAIEEQHIELPSLRNTDFPSEDLKTLKKTVFAQRIIRVKVRINTSGEVTDAKAVSGHQILRDAAETAALTSYFVERRKPVNTVLTYHFNIKQIE